MTGGSNVSIPLSWDGVPAGTRSFALSIIDPHPVAKNWVHWIVVNVPSAARSLGEGASRTFIPPAAADPNLPEAPPHHPYVVTLYAPFVAAIDWTLSTSHAAFLALLKGKVLSSATLTGVYDRQMRPPTRRRW